ncbi:hypothetical protein FQA39_LY04767 [Lamprigera yunnana]|nr:hypothetical protein FQA39_LY04767 [Lamprigera yunnana]
MDRKGWPRKIIHVSNDNRNQLRSKERFINDNQPIPNKTHEYLGASNEAENTSPTSDNLKILEDYKTAIMKLNEISKSINTESKQPYNPILKKASDVKTFKTVSEINKIIEEYLMES